MNYKLLLMSKMQKTKDGKKKFRKFFTRVMIQVKGEEEKGKQKKSLTVKFADGIETKDFIRGILTCEDNQIEIPYQWAITKKDDGTYRYPRIYVKQVVSFEPRLSESTVEFCLEDEKETEDVDIDLENDDVIDEEEN